MSKKCRFLRKNWIFCYNIGFLSIFGIVQLVFGVWSKNSTYDFLSSCSRSDKRCFFPIFMQLWSVFATFGVCIGRFSVEFFQKKVENGSGKNVEIPLKIGIYGRFFGVWTKKSNNDFRDFWFSTDKNRFFNFFSEFWNILTSFRKVSARFRWSYV